MGKSSRFFKTYINIGSEKYVFLLLFPWKMIAFRSLREITKCFRGQQKETTLYMTNCRFNCLKNKNMYSCASGSTRHNRI